MINKKYKSVADNVMAHIVEDRMFKLDFCANSIFEKFSRGIHSMTDSEAMVYYIRHLISLNFEKYE